MIKIKVLLQQNVPNLGAKNTIQKVKLGYAKNYRIPQGWAKLATPDVVQQWENEKEEKKETKEHKKEEAKRLKKVLDDTKLEIKRKLTKTGKIYGSIKEKDIASRLQKKDLEITEDQIALEEPLKQTGDYEVPVELGFGIKGEIKVIIEEKE